MDSEQVRGGTGTGDGPFLAPRIEGLEHFTLIGTGGSAVVWRARQMAFGRRVAVKALLQYDERAIRRFERECRAVGGLEHPNIVRVYHAGRTDDTGAPYLIMEYLPRGSLADKRLGWQEAVEIGVKLAGGLETAHQRGVLHRDIKPENVLVTDLGEPKLADFGIAGLAGASLSRSMLQSFTPHHVPPEVVRPLISDSAGGGVTSHRPSTQVDLYSLGSTVFTLIAGRPPFAREDDDWAFAVLSRVLSEPIPDLRRAGVPASVCAVLERAMAKEPGHRQGSALQFGTELRQAQEAAGLRPTNLPFWPSDADDSSGIHRAVEDEAGPPPPPRSSRPPAPPTARPLPPTVRPAPQSPPVPVPPTVRRPEPEPVRVVPVQFVAVPRRPDRQPLRWAIGVVVMLVLVAVVALLATRMGDDTPPSETSFSSATTSPTVTPGRGPGSTDTGPTGTAGSTPTTRPGPPAPTRGAQAAGVYATATFAPALQYRLADGGWSIPEGDSNPDWIELVRGDSQHVLNFIRVQRVYRRSGTILTAADALGAVEPVPDNFNNWLLTHPQRKETSPSQPISTLPKGASAGAQIDFTVSPGYPYENCPSSCALLFQLDGNRPAAKQKDERTRYYVFRVGDDRMVATVSAPSSDFDAFARLAEQVIASAELRPR